MDGIGRPQNLRSLARTRVSESQGAVVKDLPFKLLRSFLFLFFVEGEGWVGLRISGLEL